MVHRDVIDRLTAFPIPFVPIMLTNIHVYRSPPQCQKLISQHHGNRGVSAASAYARKGTNKSTPILRRQCIPKALKIPIEAIDVRFETQSPVRNTIVFVFGSVFNRHRYHGGGLEPSA